MKIRRVPAWRRAVPAAGLIALAAYLAAAVPIGVATAWTRAHLARTDARDDAWAALERHRGRAYADAIARIREALPEGSEYLLFDNEQAPATDMIVRFDLAPRRAVFGGPLRAARDTLTRGGLGGFPRWAVIPAIADPGPRLVETRELVGKGAVP